MVQNLTFLNPNLGQNLLLHRIHDMHKLKPHKNGLITERVHISHAFSLLSYFSDCLCCVSFHIYICVSCSDTPIALLA